MFKGLSGACVLKALHEVSGIDEATITDSCFKHGFENEKGMNPLEYRGAMRELGIRFRSMDTLRGDPRGYGYNPTVARFIRENSTGVFLVSTRHHMFVVRDGHVVDGNYGGNRRRVWSAYKVLNPTPTVGRHALHQSYPKNPLLEIIRYGASRGYSDRAVAWRLISSCAGGVGNVFRFSEVPEYTRRMMYLDVRTGKVHIVPEKCHA